MSSCINDTTGLSVSHVDKNGCKIEGTNEKKLSFFGYDELVFDSINDSFVVLSFWSLTGRMLLPFTKLSF